MQSSQTNPFNITKFLLFNTNKKEILFCHYFFKQLPSPPKFDGNIM